MNENDCPDLRNPAHPASIDLIAAAENTAPRWFT
jgi:hypothetical protein